MDLDLYFSSFHSWFSVKRFYEHPLANLQSDNPDNQCFSVCYHRITALASFFAGANKGRSRVNCCEKKSQTFKIVCLTLHFDVQFWIFAGLLVCCCSLINNAELTLAPVFPEVGELTVTRWWSSTDTRRSMKCCVILTRAVQVNKLRCQTQVSPPTNQPHVRAV